VNAPILAPPLAGQLLGAGGNDFVIAEWQDAGGVCDPPRFIAPLHLHHRDDEAWYVLEGRLRVRSGDDVIEAAAGAGVLVPRGTPHTYWNASEGKLRYLLIMTPNIHRLIAAIHSMAERTPESMGEVFRNYDSELIA
jgi:mannose-6-phosphate isomerase-like protein (cupin superfamily)